MRVSAPSLVASSLLIRSSGGRADDQTLRPAWLFVVYGIPLFVASLLQTGYAVYLGHHVVQIPLVHLINDPSVYPHDPFAATLPSYASLFWIVVAWGARLMPLGRLFIVLFLCERALVLYAAGYLARTFSPSSPLAVVGAMTIFASGLHPFVGNGTIVDNLMEQTGFAIPFLLLGIAAFYRRRPLATAVWLAVGCSVNILYGMFALSYLGAVWLLDPEYRVAWRRWVPAAGVFLMLSSPIIVVTARTFRRAAPDSALWYLAAQVRSAHHLFPLSWNKHALGMQIALMVFFLVLFVQRRRDSPRLSRHAVVWTVVGAGWLVYAFLAAYVLKTPSLLVISAGRALDLWLCFASILLIAVVASAAEESTREDRLLWLGALAGSLLIWVPELSAFAVGVGLLVLAGERVRQWVTTANTRSIASALVAGLFLLGAADAMSRSTFVARPGAELTEVARWAQRNTTRDAVFLIDPTWGAFRALSRRPVFVTFEDGTAILWDRSFVREWVDRLRAIGIDIADGARISDSRRINSWLTGGYERLRDADAQRLSTSSFVRYWVVPRDHPSSFPVVYQTASNKVLEVQ